MTAILPILFLAFLAESLTEYLAKPILDLLGSAKSGDGGSDAPDPARQWGARPLGIRYVAAAVGILLALAYRVDLLALAGLQPAWSWIGYLVTGILIGRGSNYINDIADRWFAGR